MPFYPASHFLRAFEKEKWEVHLGYPHYMLQKSEVILKYISIPTLTSNITLQNYDWFNPFLSEILNKDAFTPVWGDIW